MSDTTFVRTFLYVPAIHQSMTTPAPEAGDAALLDAYARCGCEASFRRLVERHTGLVFHTAQRVVEQSALAQDVASRFFSIWPARRENSMPPAGWRAGCTAPPLLPL